MKIVGKAGELAAAAKVAAGAVNEKAVKRSPILGALLIDAAGELAFSSTDLDLAITTKCGCVIEEPGRAAVSAEALSKLLAGIVVDTEVMIGTADSGLQIKAGRSRYRLPALRQEDFPQPPVTTSTVEMSLSRDEIERLFAVEFCIADDVARFYLTGAYLHLDASGNLLCCATDGHRLALVSSNIVPPRGALPADDKGIAGVIIPGRTVDTILKLKADPIIFRVDNHVLSVQADSASITSKLIAGTFPDYRRVIPTEPSTVAEIERAKLLSALSRLNAINASTTRPKTMALGWKEGDDAVHFDMADGQMAEDAVKATTSGTGRIALSVERLMKMIDAVKAERLVLGIVSAGEPLRIKPASAGDLLAVLAPCREVD
jgi:DNA polymerase-3 subunit beta